MERNATEALEYIPKELWYENSSGMGYIHGGEITDSKKDITDRI